MNQALILGGLIVVSVIMVLYSLMPAKKDDREKILRRMSGRGKDGDLSKGPVKSAKTSATKQVIDKVASKAMKPVMPKSDEEMSTLRQKMAQAGFRHDSATSVFLASKTILGVGLAGLSMLFAWGSGQQTIRARVARQPAGLVERLSALEGVRDVTLEETELRVDLTAGDDSRERLAAEIVASGAGLLELERERASLEEVFLDLVTEERDGEAAA